MEISKKGNMNFLYTFIIGFAIVGLALSLILDVVTDMNADFTANSYADNASEQVLSGLDTIAGKFGTIALVIAVVVTIGYFGYLRMGK